MSAFRRPRRSPKRLASFLLTLYGAFATQEPQEARQLSIDAIRRVRHQSTSVNTESASSQHTQSTSSQRTVNAPVNMIDVSEGSFGNVGLEGDRSFKNAGKASLAAPAAAMRAC